MRSEIYNINIENTYSEATSACRAAADTLHRVQSIRNVPSGRAECQLQTMYQSNDDMQALRLYKPNVHIIWFESLFCLFLEHLKWATLLTHVLRFREIF